MELFMNVQSIAYITRWRLVRGLYDGGPKARGEYKSHMNQMEWCN